jgi:glycosyltransferase involved in cell wall biosynthesis
MDRSTVEKYVGNKPRGVFVTSPGTLQGSGGGVQLCTREYLAALQFAGVELSTCVYTRDRRLRTRLRNRLSPIVYAPYWMPTFVDEIVRKVEETSAEVVFFNQVAVVPLAFALRKRLGHQVRLVLLSHGLESADYIHTVRAAYHRPETLLAAMSWKSRTLGRLLLEEARQRTELDCVFTLSPFEVELERWLGARRVDWLPRTAYQHPGLQWEPVEGRFGFVGTLDHPPNYDGLRLVLEEFARAERQDFELRIVGGPSKIGRSLARQYKFVTYLGALMDKDLEAEASQWTAFLHPLFCWARGCSTKLAVGLAWQLPIVTTAAGCRGYVWQDGTLPLAKTPAEFAHLTYDLCDRSPAAQVRGEVLRISSTLPTIAEVAARIRHGLGMASIRMSQDQLPFPRWPHDTLSGSPPTALSLRMDSF